MDRDLPKFHKIMLPLLEKYADGNEHVWSEFVNVIGKEMGLTDDQLAMTYEKNPTRSVFDDRMGWARTYLYKAKLLEKTDKRKTYRITKRGQELLATNPANITIKILQQYEDFWDEKIKNSKTDEEPDETATPEEEITSALDKMRDQVKDELLDNLQSMHPKKFEGLVVELLERMGYGTGEVTRYTADGGIDGIIRADAFGFEKIYIQAKRWQNSVGRREVTQFIGDIMAKHAKKGIFITTSDFNKDAMSAANVPEPHVILVNGSLLCDFLLDNELGVTARQEFRIYEIDNDYFDEM